MELADLLNADPNTLPYFITEIQTRRKVLVRFEPLAPDDDAELRGSVWSQSIFAAVWQHYMGDGRTYKLVCIEEADKRIQGIVCVGSIAQNATLLRKNLLESAPFNQKTYRSQEYRGVGRVIGSTSCRRKLFAGRQRTCCCKTQTGNGEILHDNRLSQTG